MVTIHVKSHVGQDGTLNLSLPTDLQDTDVEVVVILNPVLAPAISAPNQDADWPADFFETTFGSCQDDPLVRLPQGEPEVREALK